MLYCTGYKLKTYFIILFKPTSLLRRNNLSQLNIMYFKLLKIKSIIPVSILLLLSITITLPHNPLSFGIYTPLYSFAIIYYWSLFYPDTLPSWTVFLVGLIQDSLFGTTLGYNALLLVFLQIVIILYKRFIRKQSFLVIWLGYSICSLYTILIQMILLYWLNHSWSSILLIISQWYITCLLYPVLHYLFNRINIKHYQITE